MWKQLPLPSNELTIVARRGYSLPRPRTVRGKRVTQRVRYFLKIQSKTVEREWAAKQIKAVFDHADTFFARTPIMGMADVVFIVSDSIPDNFAERETLPTWILNAATLGHPSLAALPGAIERYLGISPANCSPGEVLPDRRACR